jgi:hypothetical protein
MILLYLKTDVCGTEKDGKDDVTFVQLDLAPFHYLSSGDTLGTDKMHTRSTAMISEETFMDKWNGN